jgi:hypothetical protein
MVLDYRLVDLPERGYCALPASIRQPSPLPVVKDQFLQVLVPKETVGKSQALTIQALPRRGERVVRFAKVVDESPLERVPVMPGQHEVLGQIP